MKFLQYSLRALIVAGSFSGFFAGWSLLAHAGKPVSADSQPASVDAVSPLPTLPPLRFSTNGAGTSLQPLPALPPISQNTTRPRLRTRGS
jgi:hypothetical protein